MREVPQRLAIPSEETPLKKKKKKKKNQISVSITLTNSILNCSTLALFTASAGSLFHIGAILYVKRGANSGGVQWQVKAHQEADCPGELQWEWEDCLTEDSVLTLLEGDTGREDQAGERELHEYPGERKWAEQAEDPVREQAGMLGPADDVD